MGLFAESTTVPIERTKAELDRLLHKHGASQRGIMHDDLTGTAIVAFALSGRQIRMHVPLPDLGTYPDANQRSYQNERDRKTPQGWDSWTVQRRTEWIKAQWDQASRSRWRAVLLIVRAKLELIELGLSSVQREFLADIALPSGQTVGQWLGPGIEQACPKVPRACRRTPMKLADLVIVQVLFYRSLCDQGTIVRFTVSRLAPSRVWGTVEHGGTVYFDPDELDRLWLAGEDPKGA